jgi:NADH-quinone oxidoreductase subunit E
MIAHRKLDFRKLHYDGEEGKLIPALQKAQKEEGYISRARIEQIHRESGVPLARIYGVATFYSQFRLHPVGRHIVRVCHGTACHVAGANRVTEDLEEVLGISTGQTTPDRLFTLEMVSCLGCCSLAPVIMVDDATHGNLKPGDVKKIIKQYRKAAQEVVQP